MYSVFLGSHSQLGNGNQKDFLPLILSVAHVYDKISESHKKSYLEGWEILSLWSYIYFDPLFTFH